MINSFSHFHGSFRNAGTISVKTDTFSFGVVLLEILTGLPPIIRPNEGEGIDILSYVNDNIFYDEEFAEMVAEHLDEKAGKWELKVAVQLFELAKRSTEEYKKRPTMVEVKRQFEQIDVKSA